MLTRRAPALLVLLVLFILTPACHPAPNHLWARGPAAPSSRMLADLQDLDVVVLITHKSTSGAVGLPASDDSEPRRYLVAAHTVGDAHAPLTVNFHPATLTHIVPITICDRWTDSYAIVTASPEGGTRPNSRFPWRPEAPLSAGEQVYLVTHPNAPNERLAKLNPLSFGENIILSGITHAPPPTGRASPELLYVRVRDDIDLRGMSGSACVAWDNREQRLVIVGIFCGTIEHGLGVVVRPLGIVPVKGKITPALP